MRKFKFLPYLLIGIFIGCLFPIQSLFAEQPITLIINGKTITNASPQIVSDRTYVPLRVISEELGATVEWDGVNRVVRITGTNGDTNNNQTIKPENEITDNNKENNNTNIPPLIIDNTHIDNGTPDWVTSESDIFERMNQDAPRMN